MVLIHGNMSSSFHFDVLEKYVPENVRIILPDMRGFGESSYKNEVNSLQDFADDIMELINYLNIKAYSVGGWSTGGGVAMLIASQRNEQVKKLVLIESVGITGYPIFKKDSSGQPIMNALIKTKEELSQDPVQVLPILMAYKNRDKETLKTIWNALIYTHNQPEESAYDLYLEDMLKQRNLVDVDYALMYFNISDQHNGYVEGSGDIKQIKADTLIIHGYRDYVVPMQMRDNIVSALTCNKEVYKGDWGHSPFVDIEKEVCEKILSFIEE
ncbi:MAG: alpha/beta hydrolase [Clostridia bacterium]|nr:alpha/beta hydrolase [Clostridia bacterium]